MSTTPLSVAALAKAQAEAEGYQNGPVPALNPANINTQNLLGNTQPLVVQTVPTVPYYPETNITPLLQLSLDNMGQEVANNFVIIDGQLTAQTVEINVSSALLKNLVATPLLILPGRPGIFFNLISATIEYVFGGTKYTVNPATEWQIQVGSSYAAPGFAPFEQITPMGFFDQTASQVAGLINGTLVEITPSSSVNGVGIYLTSSGPNLTAGNGTAKITVSFNPFVL